MSISDLRGGQLWRSAWPGCWDSYLVYCGDGQWLRIPDPMEQGNIAVTRGPHQPRWLLNTREMKETLAAEGAVCLGQYRDYMLSEIGGYQDELD